MQGDSSDRRDAGLARTVICALALLMAAFLGPAPAAGESAPLPVYDGVLAFKSIQGPADPEEYTWELELDPEMFLKQVDDRHLQVFYGEGHPAFGIEAIDAHDAVGSTVPTTLHKAGENVVTLTVHHRDGNPAAAGAPFVYPVVSGQGWEGGFQTHIVQLPRSEASPVPAPQAEEQPDPICQVPRLVGRNLRVDRRRLRKAGCKLGRVKGGRSPTTKVVAQTPKPGTALPAGGEVSVRLGG